MRAATAQEKAQRAVIRAVLKGEMPAAADQACARCGRPAAHLHHHHGYEEGHRLDVVPLCRSCHRLIHPGEVRTRRPRIPEKVAAEYVSVSQAAELLGVRRPAMTRLVDRHRLTVYRVPWDNRIKLLRRKDVEAALRPRPRQEGAP